MPKETLTNKDLSYICAQLGLLMASGVSPRDGLELSCDTLSKNSASAVKKAVSLLDDGHSLSESLNTSGFPSFMSSLIAVGENTGNLEKIFKSLSSYYTQLDDAKDAISSAILYPSLIFILMLAVQGVLASRVLPVMAAALEQSGGSLSGASLMFAQIGSWISRNIYAAWGFLFVLVLLVSLCIFNIESFSKAFLSKTGWGKASAIASSTSVMAMALRAGANANQSLLMAIPLSDLTKPQLEDCLRLMEEGQSFGSAAESSKILEPYMAKLLDAGIKSGAADSVMEQLANLLYSKAQTKLEKTLSAVEPALVAIMSIAAGLILLSVMAPLASLIASV
ncbi:MAG: type II secretion system F family protein [Clostridiaceae bacterium]|nr:type II secretion system F family protein [Clostridiaceae bacterium]